MIVKSFLGTAPVIHPSCFIAENAAIIGNVTLAEDVNIWFGAVLRGDETEIRVGKGSNVQDNATLHGNPRNHVTVGEYVTIGHNAIVHGCTVGDDTMIGMGATVLNGAVIGKHCIIGAGALVKEKEIIPDYSLVVGVPGKVIRTMTPEQAAMIRVNANDYLTLSVQYKQSKEQ